MKKSIILGVVFLVGFANIVQGAPSQVIILRHAEKPVGEKNDKGEFFENLSEKGYQRAAALSEYIPYRFGIPDFLFAVKPNYQYQAFRTLETLAPLSYNLDYGKKDFFNLQYTVNQVDEMVHEILNNPKYDRKKVVICWDHRSINKITEKLGVSKDKLKQWPGSVFDVVYKIEYDKGKVKSFEKVPQKLMYGDRERVNF